MVAFLSLVSSPPGWGVSEAGASQRLGRLRGWVLSSGKAPAAVLPARHGAPARQNPWWPFPWWLPPWQQEAGVGIILGPWLDGDLGRGPILYYGFACCQGKIVAPSFPQEMLISIFFQMRK